LGRKLPTEQQLKESIRRGELAAPVPLIDLDAHRSASKDAFVQAQTSASPEQGGAQVVVIERPVTADDVPQLDKLALSDFVVDFSAVEAPVKGELDEAALQAYADQLCREAGIAV
jgi:type IV secretion system protein VirD4